MERKAEGEPKALKQDTSAPFAMKEPWAQRLSEAAETGTKIKVPTKELGRDNVRDWTEERAKPISESMAMVGMLVAIIINTKGIVFDGGGRLLAAMMLGWTEIEATVIKTDLPPSEWKIRQLTTSIHREKLTDWQLYENCMALLAMRLDWKQVDLAKHLAVGEPTITRWLSPNKTTENVREALKAGRITFTHTIRLGRLPHSKQDGVLAQILDGTTPTRDELDEVVHDHKQSANGTKPETPNDDSKVGRMKARLPSGATVTVAIPSLDMPGIIEALAECLRLARKAKKDRLDVKTFVSMLRNQADGAA